MARTSARSYVSFTPATPTSTPATPAPTKPELLQNSKWFTPRWILEKTEPPANAALRTPSHKIPVSQKQV